MASKSRYFTRFTTVECAMKAEAAIVAEADVVGMATDSLVLARKLKGNMFQTVLRARLTREAEGTSIVVTMGMDRIMFVFMCIFLAAFLAITVAFAFAWLRVFQSFQFSDQDRHDWLFLSMPVISIALGFALVQAGRHVSRHDGPFLLRMFLDAIGAQGKKTAPPPRPATPPAS